MRNGHRMTRGDNQSRIHGSLWLSVVAALLAIVLTAAATPAQQVDGRRWTLTLALGEQVGGAAGSLERAMRDAGFDATTPCWIFCSGSIEHPWTYDEGFAPLLALRYRLKPSLNVEAMYTRGATAETFGATGSLGHLFVRHSVSTVAAIASINIRLEETENKLATLRLGLGPAVHLVESAQNEAGTSTAEQNAARIGFVIDTGLETPARSRFFLDLRAQWRFAGSADVGPYEVDMLGAGIATLPESALNYSHFFFSAGLGLRL